VLAYKCTEKQFKAKAMLTVQGKMYRKLKLQKNSGKFQKFVLIKVELFFC